MRSYGICLSLWYFVKSLNIDLFHLASCPWGPFMLSQMSLFIVAKLYIFISHFLYPFIHQWTLCFPILAIVNNAAMNMRVHISFQDSVFIFFRYIPRSGIAGSYTSSIFNFFFFWGTSIVAAPVSPQQHTRDLFSPHRHQHLGFLVFLVTAILTGVRW